MIRKEISFPGSEILKRRTATQLVNLAGRFHSRIMIEHGNKVVNAKSMLGLLSLADNIAQPMVLTIDGSDEKEALEAILLLLVKAVE